MFLKFLQKLTGSQLLITSRKYILTFYTTWFQKSIQPDLLETSRKLKFQNPNMLDIKRLFVILGRMCGINLSSEIGKLSSYNCLKSKLVNSNVLEKINFGVPALLVMGRNFHSFLFLILYLVHISFVRHSHFFQCVVFANFSSICSLNLLALSSLFFHYSI